MNNGVVVVDVHPGEIVVVREVDVVSGVDVIKGVVVTESWSHVLISNWVIICK